MFFIVEISSLNLTHIEKDFKGFFFEKQYLGFELLGVFIPLYFN